MIIEEDLQMAAADAIENITVEALTLDDNVVGVQVLLFGVPVHYVSKTSPKDADDNQIGPCEMWLHWGHEAGRVVSRSLDEARTAIQG